MQEIVLSIMGVIVSIELVCGTLIVMRALWAWAFCFRRSQIVSEEVVRTHRPEVVLDPVRPKGPREMIMSPSRARRRAQCGCGRRVRPHPCLRPRTHHGQP